MIFNATSGSNPLNFKVVASATEPSNPQENTIWVQTDVTMYGVSFGAETSPGWSSVAGQIFISYEPVYGSGQVSTTNSALTYLRKNRMNIYGKLTAARVCLTGAKDSWKLANAYIYKSGGWVQFSSEFAATIAVTYPSGSTLTCTDGTTTLTASTTTGSYTFTVPNAGTWTVKAVFGSCTDSQDVSITTTGQSASVILNYILYDNGDERTDITGGWTQCYSSGGYITLGSTAMTLYYSGNGGAGTAISTKNKISLSGISKITMKFSKLTITNNGRILLGVGTTMPENNTTFVSTSAAYLEIKSNNMSEASLDVSGLDGEYYVYFTVKATWSEGVTSTISATLTEVKGE